MKKDFDWQGVALLSVGLASLQYVLETGTRNDGFESGPITVLALSAVVSLLTLSTAWTWSGRGRRHGRRSTAWSGSRLR